MIKINLYIFFLLFYKQNTISQNNIFSIIQIQDKNFKYYLIKKFLNFLDFCNFFKINKLINYDYKKK